MEIMENTRPVSNLFKAALLNPDQFCVTWEQVPGRVDTKDQCRSILADAEKAAMGGKVHAISITDNPGGNPAFAGTIIGIEIKKLGIEPLVHLALRDRNRNEVESLIYGLAYNGIRNILAMSGDFPSTGGFGGMGGPVFDLDPTHVMQIVKTINPGKQPAKATAKPSYKPDIFAGVVSSQYKKLESELMCQYYKLGKKIRGGADFVINQIGYDARKAQELILWIAQQGHQIPAVANIYVISYPVARQMHEGKIPGCIITDKFLEQLALERDMPDKGKEAKLLRAAKMFAIARGLGYHGAHIGGYKLDYQAVEYIIDKGNELYPRWREFVSEFDYPIPGGFYYFEKDAATGLNTAVPSPRPLKGKKTLRARVSRTLHSAAFKPTSPFFKPVRKLSFWIDRHRHVRQVFESMEHYSKNVLFDCLRCGDCALHDLGYNCPVSQCPKGQRVGACGGSIDGWCEVYPGQRKCIWVKAYDCLKAYHEEDMLGEYIIPPRDWSLWLTSSWLNYFGGRDHASRRAGIAPTPPAAEDSSRK